ncbi:hypothetical protein ACJX0J_022669, partial [Zea mays]
SIPFSLGTILSLMECLNFICEDFFRELRLVLNLILKTGFYHLTKRDHHKPFFSDPSFIFNFHPSFNITIYLHNLLGPDFSD